MSGASTILGVYPRILPYRDRLAKLTEFDIKNLDKLQDYAIAAWYVHITNLPPPEPAELEALKIEVGTLRAKYLLWATPLVEEGVFQKDAIEKIKEGSGAKDNASDVVALVGLYRASWEQCRNICAVTEADLERGALIAPVVFAVVSQKEQRLTTPTGEASQRVRRAWALPERAYVQCRRGLDYLLFEEQDVDQIAPNIRRNSGPSKSKPAAAEPAPTPTPGAPAVTPPVPVGGNVIGGGGSPFAPGS